MTTAVNFTHFRLNDYRCPLSLEEVFRLFGTWSDIHDFSFDKLLNTSSLNVTGVTGGAWTTHDQAIANLPSSFEVRFHKTAYRHALSFTFGGNTYIIGTDDNGYPFAQEGATIVEKVPKTTPQVADCVVVFRQQQFENDASSGTSPTASNLVWYSVSLYMNRALQYSFITGVLGTTSLTSIGFCAYGTDVVNYTSISVPDLPETAEFGTLDQGEVPFSGLQRTIDGRYLRYFVRFNGTFRAFRTKAIASSITLEDQEFYTTRKVNNLVDVFTHARMVGAYIWAEYFDPSRVVLYGHRFQELNNPMLITDGECEVEAQRSIIRSEESAFQENIVLPYLPLIEPEDRVITPQGDWLMTDSTYTLEDGGASTSEATIRKYGWGSP